MFRNAVIAIAFLAVPSITLQASTSCDQVLNASAARARWGQAREIGVKTAHRDESCRDYSNKFYEAVTARQTVSVCEDGIRRQQDLDALDAFIDAFNNVIAAQCGGV